MSYIQITWLHVLQRYLYSLTSIKRTHIATPTCVSEWHWPRTQFRFYANLWHLQTEYLNLCDLLQKRRLHIAAVSKQVKCPILQFRSTHGRNDVTSFGLETPTKNTMEMWANVYAILKLILWKWNGLDWVHHEHGNKSYASTTAVNF